MRKGFFIGFLNRLIPVMPWNALPCPANADRMPWECPALPINILFRMAHDARQSPGAQSKFRVGNTAPLSSRPMTDSLEMQAGNASNFQDAG